MGLVELLNSIKKKIEELLGICIEYKSTIEESLKIAKEIEGMIDEWIRRLEEGVTKHKE